MSGKINPENTAQSNSLESFSTDSEKTFLSLSEAQKKKIEVLKDMILNQGFSEEFANQMIKVQLNEWEIHENNIYRKQEMMEKSAERTENKKIIERVNSPKEKRIEDTVDFYIKERNSKKISSPSLYGRIIRAIKISASAVKKSKIYPDQ